MKPFPTRRTNSWRDLAPASRIYSDNQMSPASSTLEQPQPTTDNVQNCENNSGQTFSQLVVVGDVHHPPPAPEGGCTFANLPSPLTASCQESSTNMALVPQSLSPSAEIATNNHDCQTTTQSMASSDVTPNIGFTEPGLPLPEPVHLVMSRPLPLGISQSSQENLFDVSPEDSPCDGDISNDPRTALLPVSGCSPYLAPDRDSAVEIETSAPDISDDTELFVTRRVTFTDHRSPSGPTTIVSSPGASHKMGLPLVDSNAHFTPCDSEVLLYQNIQSHSYEARTPEPALSPTYGVPLTHQLTVGTLAWDSSPSRPDPSSDVFMDSTPPLSSPQIGRNVTVTGDLAGGRESGLTSDHAKIDYYPAMTMSSPNFTLHGDESLSSPSPPHQMIGAKRALYDDSDEEPTSVKSVKRIRTDETMSSPLRNPPAPRRATLASQKLSRRKLAAPFRSPLQTRMTSVSTQTTTPAIPREDTREEIAGVSKGEPRAEYQTKSKSAQGPPTGTKKAIKPFVRSSRVAAQFRSPLVKIPVDTLRPLVLPNQALMNLERKVTILRRATKIKRDGDEDHLERLAKKWREAGREAAYELWGIVRDLSTEGSEIRGNGNGSGWGWDDQDKLCTSGEDSLEAEEGEHVEEKQENTLGVMLRKLGIAPETLGWNEVEEAFVDNE